MVRSYQRHGPTQAFGLICGSSSNSLYDGRLAYVPGLEDVLVWDVRKSEMKAMWHDSGVREMVTCIACSQNGSLFAVGHSDGTIRIWNAATDSVVVRFNGHRKAITALAFSPDDFRLASGSQDTDIIIWDVLASEGLKRLTGHRDQITAIRFLNHLDQNASKTSFVLSASKDTFLKLWDMETWHCAETVVGHRSEVWALDISSNSRLLFTGSSDGELKAWKLNYESLTHRGVEPHDDLVKAIEFIGNIPLSSTQGIRQLLFHPEKPLLAVQTHERSIDLFYLRGDEEIRKKQARRMKRQKEKGIKSTTSTDEASTLAVDMLTPYLVIRPNGKIKSFAFGDHDAGLHSPKQIQILFALNTNCVEVHIIPFSTGKTDPKSTKLFTVDLPGHRTDIRALDLCSDDSLLASASNGQVKVWNMKTQACIRTINCGYVVCCKFLPGDRQIVAGTKEGTILLLDLASSSLVVELPAHDGSLWSLDINHQGDTIVSGGTDKQVKLWNLSIPRSQNRNSVEGNVLLPTLQHRKIVRLSDEVLAVKFSPDGKYLAVALLDSTVSIFYQDNLKFYLSLYGHKLPVLSLDISDDSKLLVTCSADKNIKIWGLDFGDCHKSIFAHEESIMQVAFEKSSHFFWSVSKDRMVKYWDGDKFVNIQSLDGHQGEIWALALSREAKFVVTASHDKSIRIWEKLEEPLFLEEEKERELEKIFEHGLDFSHGNDRDDGERQAPDSEAQTVQKATQESLHAGERIIEAIDLADEERRAWGEYEMHLSNSNGSVANSIPKPQRNVVLAAQNLSPDAYVLSVVKKISPAALTDALLVLPFSKVISLFDYLNRWAEKDENAILVSRILFFLLRTYQPQIVATRVMRTTLIPLRRHLRAHLLENKQLLMYNLSALKLFETSLQSEVDLKLDAESTSHLARGNTTTGTSEQESLKLKRKRIAI